MKSTRCVRCKLCNFSTTSAQQYGRKLGSEVTNFPGSGAYIPLGSLPSRQFRYLIRRIASLARPGNPASRRRYSQPRAPAQALPPRPSSRSSTPLSRALPAQTCHVDPWDINNYTKFICLRGSSDGASQFISATALQLTPSLPSYTTILQQSDAFELQKRRPIFRP